MHETSVAQRMAEVALSTAAEHGAEQVLGMRLLVGELTCLDVETLTFAFDIAVRGTGAQGCKLDIERVATRIRCAGCAHERGGELLDPCERCGEPGGEIIAGRELRVLTIDVDDPPDSDRGET
jgi:hydrogenase nickel incorporation protein HypA/HybF